MKQLPQILLGAAALLFCLSYFFDNPQKKELSAEVDTIFRNKEIKQKDRPDLAFEHDFEMTKDPALGYPPISRLYKEFRQLKKKNTHLESTEMEGESTWIERGPSNVAGRTRALMFDPNDVDRKRVFAGSIGGGLWVNDDITRATSPWKPINDFLPNLSISDITFDPNNTNRFYITTGLGYTGRLRGTGVFVSEDQGLTWNLLESTNNIEFVYLNHIEVSIQGTLLVSSRQGLHISRDMGATWTTFNNGIRAADIEIASNDHIIASFENGTIFKSIDDGINWDEITPAPDGQRVEIGLAPSDPNVIYAVADGGSGGADVAWFYKTMDGGLTWEEITIPPYIEQSCSAGDNHFTRGQAWFDLIISVNPSNPNRLIVGGIDLSKSFDGGLTWSGISYWTGACDAYVHADQHVMVRRPGHPEEVIFGTDGGVFYSDDAGYNQNPRIQIRNNSYNVTTFYSVAIANEIGADYLLAGAQDNGTQQFQNPFINRTHEVTGGDGGFCFVDQEDANIQVTSYVGNSYHLSLDGGKSFSNFVNNTNTGRFINPTEYDSKKKMLFAAGNSGDLIRYSGIATGEVTTTTLTPGFSGTISHINVIESQDDLILIGTGNGDVYKIINNGSVAVQVDNDQLPGGYVSSIAEGSTADHFLVTFSNYGTESIWETTNGGTNWNLKEGDLPDIPVRWAIYNPDNFNQVFIATELGVFKTDDIGANEVAWVQMNGGMANVRTEMIKIRSSDQVIAAATFGRGLFTTDLLNNQLDASFDAPLIGYSDEAVQFNHTSDNFQTLTWDFGNGGASNDLNPSYAFEADGIYEVTLTASDGTNEKSVSKQIKILPKRNLPYLKADGGDFESNQSDFGAVAIFNGVNLWEVGQPGNTLNISSSGSNVWKTKLIEDIGTVGYDNKSALYTPLFDFSEGGTYVLRFKKGMEVQFCNAPFAVQLQYSVDGGNQWFMLGSSYQEFGATNWYGRGDNLTCSIATGVFENQTGWSKTTDDLENTELDISYFSGEKGVGFRFLISVAAGYSDSGYQQDGILIDDFEIDFLGTTASFEANERFTFTEKQIQFTYKSSGAVSFTWDFGDGITSTEKNPTHIYNEPGNYDVALSIVDSSGATIQNVQSNYITILPTRGVPYQISDGGNFEVNTSDFQRDSVSGTSFQYGVSTIAGKDGTRSGDYAWVTGIEESLYQDDSESYLYTPEFDFSIIGEYILSFYAKYSFEDNWDGFIVEYSVDKGKSWEKLNNRMQNMWYNQISDPASVFGPETPIFSGNTVGEFKRFETPVSFLSGGNKVSFRFKFLSDANTVDAGVAIDDFDLTGPVAGDPVVNFEVEGYSGCEGQLITVVNQSTGTITAMNWDFGDNATPRFAVGPGPHQVLYESIGESDIIMTAETPDGIIQKSIPVTTAAIHTPVVELDVDDELGIVLIASEGDGFIWLNDGDTIQGANDRIFDPIEDGLYSVVVNVDGCYRLSGNVKRLTVGVNDIVNGLNIYPNPLKGSNLHIVSDSKGGIDKFIVRDMGGKVVFSEEYINPIVSIEANLNELKNGIYVLEIYTSEGMFNEKLLVESD